MNLQGFTEINQRESMENYTENVNEKDFDSEDESDEDYIQFGTKKTLKNVVVVTLGFLLLFTAFISIQNLQSSINKEAGLGAVSLSVIYIALILSCFFMCTPMIKYLGCKKTISLCILAYSTFFMANFYPNWYTMIPSSVILGACAAPLWVAKCKYLTELSRHYASETKQVPDLISTKFFGFFFMVFQTAQIWGNLITHLIIDPNVNLEDIDANSTEEFLKCGKFYCDWEHDIPSDNPVANVTIVDPYSISTSNLYVICGIFLACCLIASALVFIFMDDLPKKDNDDDNSTVTSKLMETLKHLRKPFQLLIIPLTIYSGLEQAFVFGDFTKSFLSCRWGVHNVGLCMIIYGITDAICSYAFVPLMARIGRPLIFALGLLLQLGVLISFMYLDPPTSSIYLYYTLGAFWGAGDSIWQTQINALYADIFPDTREPAFSNYRLWESFGFALYFTFSVYICMLAKIYILITFLVIGFACYLRIAIKISSTAL